MTRFVVAVFGGLSVLIAGAGATGFCCVSVFTEVGGRLGICRLCIGDCGCVSRGTGGADLGGLDATCGAGVLTLAGLMGASNAGALLTAGVVRESCNGVLASDMLILRLGIGVGAACGGSLKVTLCLGGSWCVREGLPGSWLGTAPTG